MLLKSLDHYDISPERGYLCQFNADEIELTGELADAQWVATALPQLIPTGRVRSLLERDVPPIGFDEIAALSDAEARIAMVHYSFMVQAYVWGEEIAPGSLPTNLAVPIVALADKLGQQPLLPYSGYVLDNWAKIDADGPVDLDNIYMIQHFLAGQDEAWFVLIHVAIEAKAGGVLAMIPKLIDMSDQGDVAGCRTMLEDMSGLWDDINGIFDRMPERCDPYVYFHRVRPYIHGWKDNPALPNGLVYEGVDKYDGKGQSFRGQTGSQSSIVPAMDAVLGIGHADDPLKAYLDQLHIYRPPGHRQFIDDVRASSHLRNFVEKAQNKGLAEAYNGIVTQVARFRTKHLEYAASYIHKQSRGGAGNDSSVGTGGTPFMKYLKKHRDESERHLIKV